MNPMQGNAATTSEQIERRKEYEVDRNQDRDLEDHQIDSGSDRKSLTRREFLRIAGFAGAAVTAGGGLAGLFAGCGDEATTTSTSGSTTTGSSAASTTTVSTGPSQEVKVLKIAEVGPFTGGAAGWGLPSLKGAQLAVELINKDGGHLEVGAGKDPSGSGGILTKSGQRYVLELHEFDGRYDPTTELEGVIKMKSEGCRVINGFRQSQIECNAICEPAKIIQMLPGNKPEDTPAGIKYVYANNWSAVAGTLWPQMIGRPGETEGKVLLNCDTVAILTENAQAAVPIREMFKQAVEPRGIKVLFDEMVDPTTTEFRTIISKLKSLKPDLMFANIASLTVVQYYPQAKELGWRPAATISQDAIGTRGPEARQIVGDGYVGNIEPFWMVPLDMVVDEELASFFGFSAQKRANFIETFTAKFGPEHLAGGALQQFDYIHALCTYLATCDDPEDSDSIAAQFDAKATYEGAWITLFWYPETHRLNFPIGIGACTSIDETTGGMTVEFLGIGTPTNPAADLWDIAVRKPIDLKKPWSDYWEV